MITKQEMNGTHLIYEGTAGENIIFYNFLVFFEPRNFNSISNQYQLRIPGLISIVSMNELHVC